MFGTKFLQINWQDLLRGLVVAVIGAVLTALLPVIQAGALPTKAQVVAALTVGLTAGLSYVIKNFLTNSKDQMFVVEPKVDATETKTT